MKTKRNRTPKPEELHTPEVKADSNPPETEAANGFKKDRFNLSFDVNADGTPDMFSIRESTKARVREFMLDEKMRSAFGARPIEGTTETIHPAAVKGLYFTLGMIEATIVPMFAKEIKPEVARAVFTYTDAELTALEKPTIAVLTKYADWFIKYQDEVALVTMLSTMTIQKVQACIILSKRVQAESAENVKTAVEDKPGQVPN